MDKDKLKKQLSDQQVKEFLRKYELKQLTYLQMYQIYKKNVLSPYFVNTAYSAIFLILAPALTNIYYTFRPNSSFANIFPFAVPIIAITQYLYTFQNDMKKYCFSQEGQDPKSLRQKYLILSCYSPNEEMLEFGKKIQRFEKDRVEKKQKQ